MELLKWKKPLVPMNWTRLNTPAKCDMTYTVNFDSILSGDTERFGEGLRRTAESLRSGFPVEKLPQEIICYAIDFLSREEFQASMVLDMLEILSFRARTSDDQCFECITPEILTFLMKTITETEDKSVVNAVFAALVPFLEPDKPQTISRLKQIECDIPFVFHNLMTRLQDLEFGGYPDSFVSTSIHFLENYFCSWDLDEATCKGILEVFCRFCGQEMMREWRVNAIHAIGFISFWKPSAFRALIDESVLDQICLSISPDDSLLSVHGFVAVDNACFNNPEAASYLVIQKRLFDFSCPADWSDDAFVHCCHALSTVISNACDRRSSRMFNDCLVVIKHRAQTLIGDLMGRWELSSFAVKEVIAHVMCNLINIGDSELIQLIITGNWILVDYLCEIVSGNDIDLICAVLSALTSLCDYGDKVAFNMCHLLGKTSFEECPNPFIARMPEDTLNCILEEMPLESPKVLACVEMLRSEVRRSLEFLEIDFM